MNVNSTVPRTIFNIASLLLVVAASLCLPLAGAAAPIISTTPATFDFGYVPEGQTVFHRYWLANQGDDTLVVEMVKPQCGCTTVPLPKDRLAPADSVPLDLSFDSKNIKGRVNKAVRIWSNDSTQYPAIIYFSANVSDSAQLIVATPPIASLVSIDNPLQVIELSNASKNSYRVWLAAPLPPFLNCEFSNDSLPPGGTITLTLTTGEGVPLGDYRASLTVQCDGDVPFPMTIPIKGVGYFQ
jgi:hypothetical protein